MTLKQDEIKNLFKDGFNVVHTILVTISLGLGTYGLTNVVDLRTETSVIKNKIENIESNVNNTNKQIETINHDKVIDKVKLENLSEKISSIDSNLKEIKADLKEALRK